MKKQSKKITMDVLAGMVQAGTKETKGFVGKEIADLAGMVQRGFLDTAKKTDIVAIKKDVSVLKADVYTLKEDVKAVKKDVADLKEDFHKILDALDKVAKQYADYMEERKMRDAEIARLRRWVEQIAQKVGVELVD